MQLLARVRLAVARHPWIYWLAVATVAGGVASGVARTMAGVAEARRSWGEQQIVWVAGTAVEPGAVISADSRSMPRAMVPAESVDVDPSGAVSRQRIGPGEIITVADVSAGGAAGLVPDGWLAFAVPVAVEHFATGDHVRVYAADQFVSAGVVVDRADADVMVAIPVDAAPIMSTALLTDSVTIALTPGP